MILCFPLLLTQKARWQHENRLHAVIFEYTQLKIDCCGCMVTFFVFICTSQRKRSVNLSLTSSRQIMSHTQSVSHGGFADQMQKEAGGREDI